MRLESHFRSLARVAAAWKNYQRRKGSSLDTFLIQNQDWSCSVSCIRGSKYEITGAPEVTFRLDTRCWEHAVPSSWSTIPWAVSNKPFPCLQKLLSLLLIAIKIPIASWRHDLPQEKKNVHFSLNLWVRIVKPLSDQWYVDSKDVFIFLPVLTGNSQGCGPTSTLSLSPGCSEDGVWKHCGQNDTLTCRKAITWKEPRALILWNYHSTPIVRAVRKSISG